MPGLVYVLVILFFSGLHVIAEDGDESDEDRVDPSTLAAPIPGQSHEEYVRCHAIPCDQWERRQRKMLRLQQYYRNNTTKEDLDAEDFEFDGTDKNNVESMSRIAVQKMELDSDVIMSEEEIDQQLAAFEGHRSKRSMMLGQPYYPDPIKYAFESTFSESDKGLVRSAMAAYEATTCLRFKEGGSNFQFHRSGRGCYSWMGSGHDINLGSGCLNGIGIPIHEVGHALGLNHEQKRHDRDEFIKINWKRLQSSLMRAQYDMATTRNNARFDFGSIMLYSPNDGSRDGKTVFAPTPKYSRYVHNIGQRVTLSFGDIQSINLAYCKDKCQGKPLSRSCQRGGYQDPRDCSKCICRPGFAGKFCQKIADSKGAQCGGSFNLQATKIIESPNYKKNPYPMPAECNWYFKVPQNHQVKITFFGVMEFLYKYRSCYHYVEVVYMKNLDIGGARFCRDFSSGSDKPVNIDPLLSEGNEMLVLFRTYNNYYALGFYGFKAKVEVVPPISGGSVQPMATQPATTTQRTTHSTTPRTTQRWTTQRSTQRWTTQRTTQRWTTQRTTQRSTTQRTTQRSTTQRTTQRSTTQRTTQRSTTQRTTQRSTTQRTTQRTSTSQTNSQSGSSSGSVVWECDFEGSNMCDIRQDSTDNFDWKLTNEPTPSKHTGPSKAHSGSYYIFIEASGKKKNDKARIITLKVPKSQDYCLEFWYHMHGFHIRTLNVYKYTPSSQKKTQVWTESGDKGDVWKQANFRISSMAKGDKVMFEGVRGDAHSGDIALDDIKIRNCS